MSDSNEYVYVSSITLRNGKRIFASSYGKKAFRIKVKPKTKEDGILI